MKRLALLALVAVLGGSCTSLQREAVDVQGDPTKTQAEKDAAVDAAVEEGVGTIGYLGGAVGAAGGPGGVAATVAITALSWWMRDRRKRKGRDPLQRTDVQTPPVT